MKLPEIDVNRFRKMNGIEKKQYGDYLIRLVTHNYFINSTRDIDKKTGATNRRGMFYVQELNKWLKETAITATIFYIISKLAESLYDGSDVETNDFYKKTSITLGTISKKLAKQRRVFKIIKCIFMYNPVDSGWDELLKSELLSIKKRNKYLCDTFLPTILEFTPIFAYYKWLEEHEISLEEDIVEYCGESFWSIDNFERNLDDYYSHVEKIIEEMKERDDIKEAIKQSAVLMKEREKRLNDIYKKEKEEKDKQCRDVALSELDALSSNAEKQILRTGKRLADRKMYALIAARVSTNPDSRPQVGYVHTRGSSITKDPYKACLYRTEEEAVSDGEWIKKNSCKELIYNVVPIFRNVD